MLGRKLVLTAAVLCGTLGSAGCDFWHVKGVTDYEAGKAVRCVEERERGEVSPECEKDEGA